MNAPAPFSCTYTPNFAELLLQLNTSLAISTYQAGKVVLISPKNAEELVQLPRTFHSPMGMALKENKLAIATKSEVVVTVNNAELAKNYPKSPNKYDSLFLPTATYNTGQVDTHDLHYGDNERLFAVNTSFSCLTEIDDNFSFTPVWKPKFITDFVSEDRCHLNGLAMANGQPKYLSALGTTNTHQGWRDTITSGGVIFDIESSEVIAQGLAMPHSPRIINGKLYCLLSAAEKLVEINPQDGKMTDVAHIPGFVRGMTTIGDYAFIATSKLRQNSSTFKHLKIAQNADVASIVAVHLPTGAITGKLTYLASVDEIYDIIALKGFMRPNVLNNLTPFHHQGLITPQGSFWALEEEIKANQSK